MNKSDLIRKISGQALITQRKADMALDSLIRCIIFSLKQGRRVTITGFGTFSVDQQQERMAANPRTGRSVKIEAKKVARFKAVKQLFEEL